MTAAIFGLLGVIIGGVLNGVIASVLERRRERAAGVVAARLVHEELEFIRGDFELWLEGSRPPPVPIALPLWEEHRVTLARVLAEPEWHMVTAAYTWITLHNGDPLAETDPTSDHEVWDGVISEMRGGGLALKDYLTTTSERELGRLRKFGWEQRQRAVSEPPERRWRWLPRRT